MKGSRKYESGAATTPFNVQHSVRFKTRWREFNLIIIMGVIIILTTECKKWGGSSGQRGEQEEGKADQKVECQAASNQR